MCSPGTEKTRHTAEAFDRCAENYAQTFMDLALYRPTFERFCTFIQPEGTLLDLGCGPGNVSRFFAERFPGLSIAGVDISKEMVALAQKHVSTGRFEVQDIRRLEYAANTFDQILAAFCLPFLYDEEAQAFIRKVADWLKPGGCLYLSTILGQGHHFETTSFSKGERIFFNYYSQAFLERAFVACGLEILESCIQDYPEPDGSTVPEVFYVIRKQSK